jgi:hypothetical protein
MKTAWWMVILPLVLLAGDLAAGEGRPGRGDRPHQKKERDQERERKKDKDDEAREKRKENRDDRREEGVDRREENQAKRIQHGINKGYLTEGEATALQNQQSAIASMEEKYKSDGKLTGKEAKDLHQALQEASRSIWAEKHDVEGNQMPVYRFGQNVFAKDALTQKFQTGQEVDAAEAKAIMKDFRRMMQLKHKLATEDIPPARRTILQNEYNELLNQYFETR